MGGSFIFAYNTNLSGTKGKNNWVNHTVEDVKEHFEIVKNLNPHRTNITSQINLTSFNQSRKRNQVALHASD